MEEVYIKSENVEVEIKVEAEDLEFTTDSVISCKKEFNSTLKNAQDPPKLCTKESNTNNEMCQTQILHQNKNIEAKQNIQQTNLKQNKNTEIYLQKIPNTEILQLDLANGVPQSSHLDVQGKVYENGQINRLNCSLCGKSYKNRANLKNHMKYVHTEDQAIECAECMRSFKSVLYLRSHMSSVHAKTELVKCEHCQKVFLNKKKLNNHIYYTHRQPEEQVECKVCLKTFKGPYNLKIHMRYVHPQGDPHPCPFCYKTFKVEMLLQRHMKWAHPHNGMTYKCQECNKILPSLDGFKTHMKNVHLFERATCDNCKRTFKTKKSLERHLRNVHNSNRTTEVPTYVPKEHTCQYCERTFNNTTSLFWHIERFHAQLQKLPNNLCIICNKEFSDYAALHRHLTSVHSLEKATCKICMKEFKSPINLQNHIRITHAPPEATQTCETCQKTFKCPLHLRMHVLAVHDGGQYPCDICQKTFTSTKYLSKHKKSHNESRNFQCDVCLKMYKNINSVNKHKKNVHNGVKCNICNIKQANIEDHLKKCHPKVAVDSVTRNKDSSKTSSETSMDSINTANETMDSAKTSNETVASDKSENKIDAIKSEIKEEEISCKACDAGMNSIEFYDHIKSNNCKLLRIVEVTIKMENEET